MTEDLAQILRWGAYIGCGYYFGTRLRVPPGAVDSTSQMPRANSDCKSCGAPLRAAEIRCSYCGREPLT